MPSDVQRLHVSLMEKPQGGYRPIGLFPSLYRVYMKVRQPAFMQWEKEHDRPFFAQGKGRGCVDPVWRQAVRMEAGHHDQGKAGVILWDLVKFYESLSHAKMWRECEKWGLPMAVVRVALNAYSWTRYIGLGEEVAEGIQPLRGVVAGCPLATTLV